MCTRAKRKQLAQGPTSSLCHVADHDSAGPALGQRPTNNDGISSNARHGGLRQHSAEPPLRYQRRSGSKRRRSSVPPSRRRVGEKQQAADYYSDSTLCRRRASSRPRCAAAAASSSDEEDDPYSDDGGAAAAVRSGGPVCGCLGGGKRRQSRNSSPQGGDLRTVSHLESSLPPKNSNSASAAAKLIMNTWQYDIIPAFAFHFSRGLCEVNNKRLESPAFLRFMPPPSKRPVVPPGTAPHQLTTGGAADAGSNGGFASTSSQSFIPLSQSYWRLQPPADAALLSARSGYQPTSASRRSAAPPLSQSALSSRPSEPSGPAAANYYNDGGSYGGPPPSSQQLSTSFAARLDWIRSLWSREQESFLKLMTSGIRIPCASEPSNMASELRDLRTTSAAGTLCDSFADGDPPQAPDFSTQHTAPDDDGENEAADEHLMLFEPACYWSPDLLALPEAVKTHLTRRGKLREDRELTDQLARIFQLRQDHMIASAEVSPVLRYFSLDLLSLWWIGLPEHLRPYLWEKALCSRIEHQHYDPTLHELIVTAIRTPSPVEEGAIHNPFRRLFNHHSRVNLSELCRAIADKPSLLFGGHCGWLPLAIADRHKAATDDRKSDGESAFPLQSQPGLWQRGMNAVSQTLRAQRMRAPSLDGYNTTPFESTSCWVCAEFERHMLLRAAALVCRSCAADVTAPSGKLQSLPLLRSVSHRSRDGSCHPCCPRCDLLHEGVASCDMVAGKRSTRCATIMVAGCLTTELGLTSTLSSHLLQLVAFVCAHTSDAQRALRLVTEITRNPRLPVRDFLTTGSEFEPRRQRQVIGWLQLFQSCFALKLPLLYQHFKALELGPEFYVPRLFASLFLSHLPLACASAVWDRLLGAQTAQCAIEVALGLLKYLELLLLTSSFSGCLAILSYSYFTEKPIFDSTNAEPSSPSQASSPWLGGANNEASRLISEFDDARFWRCVGYCEVDSRVAAWWTSAVDGHLETHLLQPIMHEHCAESDAA